MSPNVGIVEGGEVGIVYAGEATGINEAVRHSDVIVIVADDLRTGAICAGIDRGGIGASEIVIIRGRIVELDESPAGVIPLPGVAMNP